MRKSPKPASTSRWQQRRGLPFGPAVLVPLLLVPEPASAAGFDTLSTTVSFGAVALAIAASLWAVAATRGAEKLRSALAAAGARARGAIAAREAIIEAGDESVLVWGREAETTWAYGESQVLLDACLKGPDALLLSQALDDLSGSGAGFALCARGETGESIRVRGRAVGALAAVWLQRESQPSAAQTSDPSVLDLLPYPVWLRDRTLGLTWANRAYAEVTGAKNSAAVVSTQTPFDPGERELAAAARSENQQKQVLHSLLVSGERRTFGIREIPLQNGSVLGMAVDLGPGDEISAQRQGDTPRDLLDGLTTAVAIFGKNQRLISYNRAFAELWGLDPEWLNQHPTDSEVLDRLREQQKLPEQRDYREWKQERLAAYEKRDGKLVEEDWHLPSGQTIRVATQQHPSGGLTYFYEDVSEKLALESSYNTLIGVQRATLDALGEGVAVFGLDGRLKLHNAAFARLWRFEAAELSGEPHVQNLAALCVDRFGEATVWQQVVESIASGKERQQNWGFLERADIVLAVAQSPLPDGAFLVTFADVTDRFRAETALRERNQALLAADELKSEFVQHASFLFRNPLNAVLGFADLLSGGHAGPLTSKQRDYVQNILTAGHKLSEVTSDILDLAMIESGDVRLELARIDLYDLLSRAAEPFRQHALSRDVTFELAIEEDLGAAVVDERRIRQVVFNLLSNAVRYTPRGGEITLGACATSDEVQIFVSDSGPGIAAEVQPKAFARFEAKGRTGQRGGAGLGLALVNSFVALHGGWVEIETAEGRGTLVRCHLPRRLDNASPRKTEDIHVA